MTGRLVNGTRGAALPSTLSITLRVKRGDQEAARWVTTTAVDGRFQFSGLSTGADLVYELSTEYLDVPYTLQLDNGLPGSPVMLVVYQTSPAIENLLNVYSALLLTKASARDRRLTVVEIHRLENNTDLVLVPKANQGSLLFAFPLLEGAAEVRAQSNIPGSIQAGTVQEVTPLQTSPVSGTPLPQAFSNAQRGERGFLLMAPLPPGRYDFVAAYTAAYQENQLTFSYAALMGSHTFNLLIADGLGTVKGTQLTAGMPIDFEGVRYKVWEAKNLPVGTRLQVHLAGLPQPPWWERLQGIAVASAGVVLLFVLAVAGTWYLLRRGRRSAA